MYKFIFFVIANTNVVQDGVQSHHVSFLVGRGYVIIATPYASGFDHLRIADEAQFKFDRCLRALMDDSRYRPLVQCLILLCSFINLCTYYDKTLFR